VIVCFLATSSLLSFGHIRCRILILSPSSLVVFAHGIISVVIFSHLGFCHLASFSSDVIFGLHAFELSFVGIGGNMVGGLFLCHSFSRC
jgi:hypothetical protein